MADLPQEVFLSHANQDRDFASSLVEVMRRHSVPVWYAPANIIPAQQWHDEIGSALRRCDWFVLILSPQALASEWVKHELMYALRHHRLRSKIIPVIYQACDPEDLSWVLPDFQMIDFTVRFEQGCKELFRVWGLGYRE